MKISVRRALLLTILGFIWLTQGSIFVTKRLSAEQVYSEHISDIMINFARLVEMQIRRELQTVHGIVDLTKRLLLSEIIDGLPDRQEATEKFLLNVLAVHRHVAGLYIVRPDGDFFYVHRTDSQLVKGFGTKFTSHTGGTRKTTMRWRDQSRRLLTTEEKLQDNFDPRVRPWYLKAAERKNIIWTDPYLFYASHKPGLTVADPIFNENGRLTAIVGLDIEIDQIADLAARTEIADNGRVFLFHANSDLLSMTDLIFSSDPNQPGNGPEHLRKITELPDGPMQAAIAALNRKPGADGRIFLERSAFVRFLYENQNYNAIFLPLVSDQWPWIVGVYVREKDLLGHIESDRWMALNIVMAFSFIAVIWGLRLGRAFTRPLEGIANEALSVQRSDFNSRYDTDSIFLEFQRTADAVHNMKEALRHSEDKYRQIFENLPDVYFELSLDGRLLEISPSIEKFSGYRRPALLGTSMRELCADPVECVRFEQALASAGQVKDFELTMLNHNRTVEYCSISAQCTSEAEDGVSKIVGFLRVDSHRKRTDMEQYGYKMRLEELVRERTADWEKSNQQLRAEVENRLQKENELRWSETKYRTIIESLENGYYEVDRQGNLTFFNRALCQLLGHSPQETAGLNLRRYLEPFTGQQLPEIFRNLPAPDVESVTTLCYLSSKAGRRRTVEISVTPMFDTHQQVAGARGLVQDITDRIDAETEKKKLEERFHQIQRLEGIGTLAGGVAHDFNNLMMGIQGNVSLILMETDKVSPHYERLKNIEANVHTGAELTRKLLGFARGGKYVVKPTDLNQLVSNSARLFGRTRKEINVVEKLQPDAWSAKVDGSQIELVLFNLLINAWQAMPDGGNIYLETENVNLPEGPAYSLNIPAGRYVRISIADTGTGMDEPTQKRIFEPFFTTKDLGRGTGLGLASAYGIAKNHGGAIDFTSVLGQGTIFYLYLPAYADAMSMESAPIAAAQATGSSLVLLVDDEGMILKTGRWMLEKLGYQVLAAQSGVEAVTLFSEHHREIALVILDLVMPEMDGQALFHRLRQIDSSVKVLISSGYDRNEKIEELLSRGGAEFIQKPFNIQYLGAKLSEMIGPRS